MRIEVLDKKVTNDKSWFLGKISLWDYLSAVKSNNFEFDIQRGIVKNRYLDSILTSISNHETIPPIAITVDNYSEDGDYIDIVDGEFNILDGLQRTYRLWLYKEIADISTPDVDLFGAKHYDVTKIVSKLKDWNYYIPGIISVTQIKSFVDCTSDINIEMIEQLYKDFNIYLYIWSGLSERDIVQKMLILNAGQRKVSIGHQYELIFLQIFKDKLLFDNVKLTREKDLRFGAVKSGHRDVGEFIFSSTIIGIQSLIAGQPMRLSPDNLEFSSEDEYISEEQVTQYFNQPFLNVYLKSLYEIDCELQSKNDLYLKWFVKDTSISGVMGAIGFLLRNKTNGDFNQSYEDIVRTLVQKIHSDECFEIEEFYLEYNNLSSQKINIGDKVRRAIYNYTIGILNDNPIKWSEAFINKID